ncbi:3-phosphoserine/phosphohydroxythreonine transaminase [Pseudomonas sp.]|uniref:3-phosphoserine/phosphohydroxythreonine transaminase n=1 Tax=Pseudomonas sp. TaxID=306 RepID=UPI003D0BD781
MVCISSERPERYNFAAGPAMLPAEVLAQIREELPDWQGSALSILEQPFTGAAFKQLMAEIEQQLRTLLAIPSNYRVLFLQGGASAQFGLLPLNLLRAGQCADYLDSGHWARKAIAEARRHAPVNIVASAAAEAFTALPPLERWQLAADAGYCHITSNETGNGLQLHDFPELAVPLVADMTSDFLTRPVPVERFGLIYASAQKNLGVAGLCLVIVRDDLLRAPPRGLPAAFSYAVQAEQDSRFNTPPTFALYVAGLMLRWIARRGGLAAMATAARERSRRLYRRIDTGEFYRCPQRPADRSTINVCFQLADARLLERFLARAADDGLLNLRGHGAIGGVRASLYNAMPLSGVERLTSFMNDFERLHG